MRYLWNIVSFVALFIVPIIGMAWLGDWLQTHLGWNIWWIEPFFCVLLVLLIEELLDTRLARPSFWATVSKTWRDKIVFALGLIAFGVIGLWPFQQNIEPGWIKWLFFFLGFGVFFLILHLFGTAVVRYELWHSNRKKPAGLPQWT